jgi:hypothetical protein
MTVVFPLVLPSAEQYFLILVTKVNYVFCKLPPLKVPFHFDLSILSTSWLNWLCYWWQPNEGM